MERKIRWICLSTLLGFLILIILQQTGLSTSISHTLLSYLTRVDKLPPEKIFDAVYILGGNQESLKAKYKTVASIYAEGRCKEITILSRPGITEYNNFLGRNLINDEWSLLTLEGLNVSKKDVQTLKIEPGFFGTYTEAEWVSKEAGKSGWKSLLLITSPHHTKRVKKCFAHFIDKKTVKFWVVGSKYKVGLQELLSEFFKLKFYEIFLLL